jgi:beta-lactam-binding protein with PASTA domain
VLLALLLALTGSALSYAQPTTGELSAYVPPHAPAGTSDGPPPAAPPSEGSSSERPPPREPNPLGAFLGSVLGQLRVMPKVTGMPLDQARMVLMRAGMREVRASPAQSEQPRGVVMQQSPAAGRVIPPNPPVTLTVSDGSLVRVPDLAGTTPLEAQRMLGRRLQLGDGREQSSDAQPPGRIISTDPPAGALAQIGSSVAYAFASDLVVVPDLRGQSPDQAGSVLSDRRLQLGAGSQRFARSAPGLILSTDPPAGTRVKPGSSVGYVASTDRVAVPNVVSLSEASADSVLDRAGFPHATAPVGPNLQKVDAVASQYPRAGAVASIATTVQLTLQTRALPPPPPPPPPSSSTNAGGPGVPPASGAPPASGTPPASGAPSASGTPASAAPGTPPLSSSQPVVKTDGTQPTKVVPPTPQPPGRGWLPPALTGLAAGALAVALAAVGWSAAWPLRTRVAVSLGRGIEPLPSSAEPAETAPELRLEWTVPFEPPIGVEPVRAEETITQGSPGA